MEKLLHGVSLFFLIAATLAQTEVQGFDPMYFLSNIDSGGSMAALTLSVDSVRGRKIGRGFNGFGLRAHAIQIQRKGSGLLSRKRFENIRGRDWLKSTPGDFRVFDPSSLCSSAQNAGAFCRTGAFLLNQMNH
jgi:hypothetical protein